jgi:hypothetical protein
MSDDRDKSKSSNWIDAEFAGEHGTTASPDSLADEKEPEFHPQSAQQAAEKVKEEAADEPGVIGKAKKALEEVDRQVAGEYEKRDDRVAPAKEEAKGPADESDNSGTRTGVENLSPEPEVARAAVEAESERFDGLINEPGNPPRQPGLDTA